MIRNFFFNVTFGLTLVITGACGSDGDASDTGTAASSTGSTDATTSTTTTTPTTSETGTSTTGDTSTSSTSEPLTTTETPTTGEPATSTGPDTSSTTDVSSSSDTGTTAGDETGDPLAQCLMMVDPGDACGECACNSCIDELQACEADEGCTAIRMCVQESGCGGADCLGPCGATINQYGGFAGPSANKAIALGMCVDSSCADQCSG